MDGKAGIEKALRESVEASYKRLYQQLVDIRRRTDILEHQEVAPIRIAVSPFPTSHPGDILIDGSDGAIYRSDGAGAWVAGAPPAEVGDQIEMAAEHIAATAAHGATGAVVGTTNTQTLTNKTLTSPVLTAPQINDTSANHQYIFAVSELAADRTVTLPLLTGNDTFVFAAFAQTLTNKTLTAPTIGDFTNAQHAHTGASSGGQIAHASLTGIGTNSHATIDTHIATADIHVAHSGVTMTAGDGLAGGGTIAATRTFSVSLSATSGLELTGTSPNKTLQLADSVAGNGLAISGKVLAVGVANTIQSGAGAGLSVESNAVRLTASYSPGAASSILASDATGKLTLPLFEATTSIKAPLLTTASGDLTIDPVGVIKFPVAQTLKTTDFDSSYPIEGWQINEVAGIAGQSALTIGKIAADELSVRVFVADETRVDRGNQYWTKSYGIVAEPFITPAAVGGTVTVTFEDSPALSGAIFTVNDWILFRVVDISSGLSVASVWGQVSSYTSIANNRQTWTFTLRSGPLSQSIKAGSVAIDFGASGAALIHLSVLDAAGSPYIKMRKWAGANPYTPANLTTHVQIGELASVSNASLPYAPTGYGLYVRSANAGQFILADDTGLLLQGVDLKLFNGATQTVNISNTGTNVWIGLGAADKRLYWDGTNLNIVGSITLTNTIPAGSVSGLAATATSTDFANITGATKPANNATVGAAWGTNLTGRPVELTDGRVATALNAAGTVVTKVVPATLAAPGSAGLYLGSDYLGFYNGSAWKTYMSNAGHFYLSGTGTNALAWDGTNLNIVGSITLTNTIPAGSVSGLAATATSTDFANITGATKPANNATVGAAWGTNLTGRPVELTDGRVATALNAAGTVVTKVVPATLAAPGSAGLYLGSDYLGFYNGSAWKTYMSNAGHFYLSGTGTNALAWDGTNLNIVGSITLTNTIPAGSVSGLAATATSTDFANITGATKPANNATVGAAWGTNLTGRPVELTDGRVATALNAAGTVVTKVVPATLAAPGSAGLYLGSDYLGFYNGSAWKTYMSNAGHFYLSGTGTNALAWDGTNLNIVGSITLTNTIPAGSVSGLAATATSTDFANITGATKPANNATVGAAWGTNLTGRPVELTDGRVATALNAAGTVVTKVVPATLAAPGSAGLYLGSDYLGFYNGSAWKTYMSNAGHFYLSGTGTNALAWDGTTLGIVGAITATTGTIAGDFTVASPGRIIAGGGHVIVSTTGIDVSSYDFASQPNPTENVRSIAWWPDASTKQPTDTPDARIWGGRTTGGDRAIQFDVDPNDAASPRMWLQKQQNILGFSGVKWVQGLPGLFLLEDAVNDNVTLNGVITVYSGSTFTSYTHLLPGEDFAVTPYNLGSAVKRWGTVYANNMVISGAISGETIGGAEWEYAGSMTIDANAASNTTVSIVNQNASYTASLDVEGNITLGGTVDGVDLASFKSAYDSHSHSWSSITSKPSTFAPSAHALVGADHTASGLTVGHVIRASGATTFAWAQLAHSDLSGVGTNSHATIDSHIAASDIHVAHSTVTMTAGDGLTGGGTIAANRTMTLGTPSSLTATSTNAVTTNSHTHSITTGAAVGLSVSSTSTEGSGASIARASHTHAIASSPNPGVAASILASDATGKLTLPLMVATTSLTTPLVTAGAGQSLTLQAPLDLILDPTSDLVRMGSGASLQASSYASQTTGWRVTDAGEADFRYMFVDEMHAKSFIADLEQALAGGQIIAKSVAVVATDFTLPTAGNNGTLRVRDLPSAPNMAVFQSGDFVGLRLFSRAAGSLTIGWAWGTVTNYVDGTGGNEGTQTWTFSRNPGTPGAATGVIPADALALDFGVSGNGFYEVNAIDGAYGQNSPYAQIVTWATHPATQTVRARLGNLRGIFSVANEFGLYAGSGTAVTDRYIRASSAALELRNVPLALYDGSDNTLLLSAGTNNNSPFLAMGSPLPTGPLVNDGIWAGKDGSVYELRVGTVSGGALVKGLHWDGANLVWKATNTSLDASGNLTATNATLTGTITADLGAIGGWTIASTGLTATNIGLYSGAANTARLQVGTGSNVAGVNSVSAGTDIAFWAGKAHADRATSPFRVTAGGAFYATTGTIAGDFTVASAGRIIAGGGHVITSSAGIDLSSYDFASAPNPTENVRSISWWPDASAKQPTDTPDARIWGGRTTGGDRAIQFDVDPNDAASPRMWLQKQQNGLGFSGVRRVTGLPGLFLLEDAVNDNVTLNGVITVYSGSTFTSYTHLLPGEDFAVTPYNLGSAVKRWGTVYANNMIVSGTISGTTLGGAEWEYAGSMVIDANAASNTTVSIVNQNAGAYTASLDVEGNITLGGNVDGVDLSGFKSTYDTHAGNANAHHARSHSITSTSDHTASGLTTGHVLRASGTSSFAWAQLAHSDLSGVGTNSHATIDSHIAATAAHGATGAVVGTTNTQTLTNKTLTTPTIGDFTNAQHAHTGASSGGTIAHGSLTGVGANDHHNQSHALASTSGLGADHTVTGLTARQVLRATSATNAAFGAIEDADLPSTIVRTSRQIIAGNGLTGGGALSSDVTVTLGTPSALTATSTDAVTATSHTHSIDSTIARSAITITAGNGLTGGGDLTANRTVTLGTPSTLTATSTNAVTSTSHTHSITTGAAIGLSVSSTNTEGSGASIARADHTHAITTSSNPGAAASILASSAAGALTLVDMTVTSLSASRLVASDGSDKLVSTSLNSWIAGTANRVTVSDDGDGTVTLSAPQDIHTAATPTFGGLIVSSMNSSDNLGVPTLRFVDQDTSSVANQQAGRIEFYTSDSTPGPVGVHSYIAAFTEGTSGLGALLFATGQSGSATERMRITSGGNVGIGITPDVRFSVFDGSQNVQARFGWTSTAGLDPLIRLTGRNEANTTSRHVDIQLDSEGYFYLFAPSAAAPTTKAIIIDSTGKVGINGVTPTSTLHVSGTGKFTGSVDSDVQFLGQASDTVSAPSFSWTSDTNTGLWRPAADTLSITTGGTEVARFAIRDVAFFNSTLEPWNTTYRGLQLGAYGSIMTAPTFNAGYGLHYIYNAYYDTTSAWKYQNSNPAASYLLGNSGHTWRVAPTGTADNALTWTAAMTLDLNSKLTVTGDLEANGTIYADGGIVDFGTNYFQESTLFELKGAKAFNLNQTIQASGWSMSAGGALVSASSLSAASLALTGAATITGDLTVGGTVLQVNSVGTRIGINRVADQQFDLDIAGAARAQYWIGPHALQLKNAAAIIQFDGPAPYALDYSGSSLTHMGVSPTTETAVIYRPGRFGKAAQLAAATTNYCQNPSFETELPATDAEWGLYNSPTAAQSTDAYVGLYSLAMTTGTTSNPYLYASNAPVTLATGQTWTFSAYVKAGNDAAVGNTVALRLRENGDGAYLSETVSTLTSEWQRISVTRTLTHATPTALNRWVYHTSAANSGEIILIDAVQLEQQVHASPYCDGSLGSGHAWTGTEHASTSTRASSNLTYSKLVNPAAYTVGAWFKVAAAEHTVLGASFEPIFFQIGAYSAASSATVGKYYTGSYLRLYTESVASSPSWAIAGSNVADINYESGEWVFIALSYDGSVHKVYVGREAAGDDGWFEYTSAAIPDHYSLAERLDLKWTSVTGLDLIDGLFVLDTAADAKLIRSIYESNAPVFAESSVISFRAPTKSQIWVDEFGFWAKGQAGGEAFGIFGGDPRRLTTTKSWGGVTMEENDIVIGRTSAPSYTALHWDDSAGELILGRQAAEHLSLVSGAVRIKNATTVYANLTGSTFVLGNVDEENLRLTTSGIEFRNATEVQGSLSGTSWTLGKTGASENNIVITPASISLNRGGVAHATLTGTDFQLGTVENILITPTALQFRDGSTIYAQLDGGSLTLGNTSNEHVLVNTSGVALKDNATVYALFAATSTIGITTAEHISISGTSIQFKDGSTVYTDLTGGTLTLGLSTAEHVLVNTSGVALKDNTTVYAQFAATTTIGVTTTDHISVSSTSIQLKDGSSVYTDLTSGTLTLGLATTENVRITSTALEFRNSSTVIGSLDGTTLTLGQTSGNHVVITATSLDIKHNGTPKISLNSSGDASFTGSINATGGTVGGWTLGESSLTGGSATLSNTGKLTLGTSNDVLIADAGDATYRLYIGNADPAQALFSVSKTGILVSKSGLIAGWAISTDRIQGGADAKLYSTGKMALGTILGMIVLDPNHADWRIWVGAGADIETNPVNSQFRVSKQGYLTASGATITGNITAEVGYIGGGTGWTIAAGAITSNNIGLYAGAANSVARIEVGTGATLAGINSASNAAHVAFWAGSAYADRATAAFNVTAGGALTASNATVTGTITANAGHIGGTSGWAISAGEITSVSSGATAMRLSALGASPFLALGATAAPGLWMGDGMWMGQEEATTNLVSNPSFETNTTGWTDYSNGSATGTRTRVTTHALAGTYSYEIVKTGGGTTDRIGTYRSISVVSGQTYTFSAWVKVTAITGGNQAVRINCQTNITNTSAFLYGTGDWRRVSVTATATGTGTANFYIWIDDCTTATIYIDAVQVENKAYATPYIDGSMATGTWAGTAHASASSRTAATRARMGLLSSNALTAGWAWDGSALNVVGSITATSGSITGAMNIDSTLTMGTGGVIKSGATAYNSGTGYWLEHNGGTPRLFIGNSAGNKLLWTGTQIELTGAITATGGSITGTLSIGASGKLTTTNADIDTDGLLVRVGDTFISQAGYRLNSGATTFGGLWGQTPISTDVDLVLSNNKLPSSNSYALDRSAYTTLGTYAPAARVARSILGAYTLNVSGVLQKSASVESYAASAGSEIRLVADAILANSSPVLTVANEGHGNGIDADTLDGSHATAFASSTHNHTGIYAPVSHTHAFGDISGNGNISTTGTLTVASNADGTHIIGRAKIGTPATDSLYLSHFDHLSTTNYALAQTSAGLTLLNSASGQSTRLAVSNTSVVSVYADKVDIAQPINAAGAINAAVEINADKWMRIKEISSAPGASDLTDAQNNNGMYGALFVHGDRLVFKFRRADGSTRAFGIDLTTVLNDGGTILWKQISI